ncbi:type IV CRISPR-associated protein Csf2 [Geoalkalibacter subterraneus]|uniref:CRISPR-associated protein n=1 Tax=Geoalkalibacter subterraneus TaxID=483547 RepID=A0A0B5FLD6_9BACT|nr:type IV CRISPR-associated protein Csf2 [Geoalkalibacter subterraneus]AJF08228.1 hypothetical protein GSUB_17230 [Geoalkalibacter subterraneus]
MAKALKNIVIHGEITLLTGMTVASTEDTWTDGKRIFSVKPPSQVAPCTSTQKYGIVETLPDDQGEMRTQITRVPIFPANGLRGQLRRAAADMIASHLVRKGEKLDLRAFHILNCGASTGSPEGVVPPVSMVQEWAAHPYFGLYGGGPFLMSSGFRIDTMWMKCRPTVEIGMVAPDSDALTLEPWQATQVVMFKRVDDVIQFRNPFAENLILDYEESVNAWLKHREGAGEARKKAKEENSGEKIQAKIDSWSFFEMVLPGARFDFNTTIHSPLANQGHVGLLVKSLESLINKQALGGWSRNGFGRFAANLDFVGEDVDGKRVQGRLIHFDPTTRQHILGDHDALNESIAAWQDRLEDIQAKEIERLCFLSKKGTS